MNLDFASEGLECLGVIGVGQSKLPRRVVIESFQFNLATTITARCITPYLLHGLPFLVYELLNLLQFLVEVLEFGRKSGFDEIFSGRLVQIQDGFDQALTAFEFADQFGELNLGLLEEWTCGVFQRLRRFEQLG
jgi:hypothetical protein